MSRKERKERLDKALDDLEAALGRVEAELEKRAGALPGEPLPAVAEGQPQEEGYGE